MVVTGLLGRRVNSLSQATALNLKYTQTLLGRILG
jgi:hypothetical protein